MAATLLQTTSLTRTEGTGTTQTFSFASGVPSGSGVILTFVHYPGGNPTGVTDNQGNTYTLAVRADSSGNQAEIWQALNITSDGSTPLVVTATFSAGGNYTTGVATAWSGILGLDQTAPGIEISGYSTTHTIAASSANTQADMLAITCAVVNDGVNDAGLGFASSGWNLLWRENNSNGYEAGQAGYRHITAVETTSVTHSTGISTLLHKVLATYRVSSGSGGTNGSASGSVSSVSGSAPGASGSGAALRSASVASLPIAAPSGAGSGSALRSSALASASATAPAGSASGAAQRSASLASASIVAPNGTASGGTVVNGVATGAVSAASVSAASATASGAASGTSALAGVGASSVSGSAGGGAVAIATATSVAVAAVNASANGAGMAPATVAPIYLAAPSGVASAGTVVNASASASIAAAALDAPSATASGATVINGTAESGFAVVSVVSANGGASGTALVGANAEGLLASLSANPVFGQGSGNASAMCGTALVSVQPVAGFAFDGVPSVSLSPDWFFASQSDGLRFVASADALSFAAAADNLAFDVRGQS